MKPAEVPDRRVRHRLQVDLVAADAQRNEDLAGAIGGAHHPLRFAVGREKDGAAGRRPREPVDPVVLVREDVVGDEVAARREHERPVVLAHHGGERLGRDERLRRDLHVLARGPRERGARSAACARWATRSRRPAVRRPSRSAGAPRPTRRAPTRRPSARRARCARRTRWRPSRSPAPSGPRSGGRAPSPACSSRWSPERRAPSRRVAAATSRRPRSLPERITSRYSNVVSRAMRTARESWKTGGSSAGEDAASRSKCTVAASSPLRWVPSTTRPFESSASSASSGPGTVRARSPSSASVPSTTKRRDAVSTNQWSASKPTAAGLPFSVTWSTRACVGGPKSGTATGRSARTAPSSANFISPSAAPVRRSRVRTKQCSVQAADALRWASHWATDSSPAPHVPAAGAGPSARATRGASRTTTASASAARSPRHGKRSIEAPLPGFLRTRRPDDPSRHPAPHPCAGVTTVAHESDGSARNQCPCASTVGHRCAVGSSGCSAVHVPHGSPRRCPWSFRWQAAVEPSVPFPKNPGRAATAPPSRRRSRAACLHRLVRRERRQALRRPLLPRGGHRRRPHRRRLLRLLLGGATLGKQLAHLERSPGAGGRHGVLARALGGARAPTRPLRRR